MNNSNKQYNREDNIPLARYLLPEHTTVMKKRQQNSYFQQPSLTLNTFHQGGVTRRPSYPATPSSLLDSFSEDEDDEDLIPIAYISTAATIQKKKFQSIADKYKEKVKAQLEDIKVIDDDDDLPLSKSCFFN
ncbi:unnamed protein product [Mucor hiemalis]